MVLFENMDLRELAPSIIDVIGHRSEKPNFQYVMPDLDDEINLTVYSMSKTMIFKLYYNFNITYIIKM